MEDGHRVLFQGTAGVCWAEQEPTPWMEDRQTIGEKTSAWSTDSRSGETPTAYVASRTNKQGKNKTVGVRAKAHFI